jgi:Cytochrome P460
MTIRIPAPALASIPSLLAIVLALLSATPAPGLQDDEPTPAQIPFPAGYREWVHIKSALIGPGFPAYPTEGGIHHVYANKAALAGFKTGAFDDGSIVVYDLLSLSEKAGIGTEAARRRIDVMVKDSKLYPATSGWGFGRFMGDDREHDILTPEIRQTCYQCHQSQKAQGFVFSQFKP